MSCSKCKKKTCGGACSPPDNSGPTFAFPLSSFIWTGDPIDCNGIVVNTGDAIDIAFANLVAKVCGIYLVPGDQGIQGDPGADAQTMFYVTYLQLTTLITNLSLIEGAFYTITDFQTIYDQPDFVDKYNAKGVVITKTAAIDPIVVLATSSNTISKEAWQPSFPQDKLQYDITFNSTEIMSAPAKGKIIERIDNRNNRTDYDHRTVLFKRYETIIGSGIYDNFGDTGFSSGEFLTFVNTSSKETYIGNTLAFSWPFLLGNNVFMGVAYNNKIGTSCINNTFLGTSKSNVCGNGVEANVIDNDFKWNVTQHRFFNNIIGGSAIGNNFAGQTFDNIIGDNFRFNKIHNFFTSNTIGLLFDRNNILDSFQGNTIANNFFGNVVSSKFRSTTTLGDFINMSINREILNCVFPAGMLNCRFEPGDVLTFDFSANTRILTTYTKVIYQNIADINMLYYFDINNALTSETL